MTPPAPFPAGPGPVEEQQEAVMKMREPLCADNPRTDGQPWEPWEGNGPCQDCGARNIIWHAPNEVWNAVMGAHVSDDGIGILCPTCFVIRAFNTGFDPCWCLAPETTETLRLRIWLNEANAALRSAEDDNRVLRAQLTAASRVPASGEPQ